MIRLIPFPYKVAIAISLIAGAYALGIWHQSQREGVSDLKGALETHEDINDADVGHGDADVDRGWLRDFIGSD